MLIPRLGVIRTFCADNRNHLAGNHVGIRHVVKFRQHDDEFVTPQPRHRIDFANEIPYPFCYQMQDLIFDMMTEVVHQQDPVRQPCQRVAGGWRSSRFTSASSGNSPTCSSERTAEFAPKKKRACCNPQHALSTWS